MIIPDESLLKAIELMKQHGFELGKVYSDPYARAFMPQQSGSTTNIK